MGGGGRDKSVVVIVSLLIILLACNINGVVCAKPAGMCVIRCGYQVISCGFKCGIDGGIITMISCLTGCGVTNFMCLWCCFDI